VISFFSFLQEDTSLGNKGELIPLKTEVSLQSQDVTMVTAELQGSWNVCIDVKLGLSHEGNSIE
jgi:hypothetical protein